MYLNRRESWEKVCETQRRSERVCISRERNKFLSEIFAYASFDYIDIKDASDESVMSKTRKGVKQYR